MDDLSLLRRSELFRAFEPEEMVRIVAETSRLHVPRGDPVFGEGEPADRMFIVCVGRIAIARRSNDDKESIVALREAGDLFGDMELFDGDHRTAGARALEPSELVVVPFAPLAQVLDQRPTLLWPMATLLCRRLRAADAALADSLFLDVTGRTAKRLLELSAGRDEFALPVTQEELAGMVGASRERVNKALASFIRLGWLATTDRHYRILRRAEVAERAR